MSLFNYPISKFNNYSIPLPLSRFHQLADLALHEVSLERADVADVEFAIQMIGFVQKSAGQQIVAGLFEPLPIHILRPDSHFSRA